MDVQKTDILEGGERGGDENIHLLLRMTSIQMTPWAENF